MIALIDYGAGNTASVANAMEDLNAEFIITDNPKTISEADKIIFPGVGEASSAINRLNEKKLTEILKVTSKPLLGICLGMQLLCDFTEEGGTKCLGIIPGSAEQFNNNRVKVPHMGWNQISILKHTKILNGITSGEYFYFANSFYIPVNKSTSAQTYYDLEFSSVIESSNYFGVQFHPEKSGEAGLKILRNFIELC